MATIDYTDVTVPEAAPYDRANPLQNLENWAYVQLQILAKMKAAGFTQSDPGGADLTTVNAKLTALVEALS